MTATILARGGHLAPKWWTWWTSTIAANECYLTVRLRRCCCSGLCRSPLYARSCMDADSLDTACPPCPPVHHVHHRQGSSRWTPTTDQARAIPAASSTPTTTDPQEYR